MPSKSCLLPVLLSFAVGAFANAAPAPVSAPAVPPTLDTLLPELCKPFTPDSLQWLTALEKLAANAARPGAEKERASFASALCAKASDTKLPATVRFYLLRQLALIGGPESVEPLTALFSDENVQVREYARQALELNSDPRATAVLLATLAKGGDVRWQTGFIHSLGQRRAAAAVKVLEPRLQQPEYAEAVIIAFKKIATPEAIHALQTALPSHPAAAGDALLAVAQKLPAKDGAAIIAKVLAGPGVSPSQRATALKLLASADPAAAQKEVAAPLAATNPRLQTTAVAAMVTLDGKNKAVASLLSQWAQLHTAARIALLQRVEASDEKAVLALPEDSDEQVQQARIEALGRIGSAASVPVLLNLAGAAPRENSPIAAALSVINGPGADEALLQAAAQGDPKARAAAITVLGWRGSKAAAPELVRYAADSLPAISRAACVALKSVGTDAELPGLLDLLLAGKAPNVGSAIRGIASRSLDRSPAVAKVVAKAKHSTGPELVHALEALGILGGPEALKTIVEYTHAPEPEIAAGAVQALCASSDFEAVAPLLAVGADAKFPDRLRVIALRATEGIILGASPKEVSHKQQVEAAVGLLHTATRQEEKALAVSVLGSIPNRAAADVLLPMLADTPTQGLVSQACLNLAEKLLQKRDRGTASKLALAVQKTNPEPALAKRTLALLKKASSK